MAHFAELDENNIVLRVIVVNNSEILHESGVEQESIGINFCQGLLGGIWKQTSYNETFRKNYAAIGFIYDESRDAFIAPKPYPSWVLNEDTCIYEPPIPYPSEGFVKWDEETTSWVEVT